MLSTFFKSTVRIQALLDDPAGGLFEGFAQALSETGYSTTTARRYLRAAEHLSCWSDRHGIPVCNLNEQSLARFERHLRPRYNHANQARMVHGARVFLTHLRDARIVAASAIKQPVDEPPLLSAFCQWMREHLWVGNSQELHDRSPHVRAIPDR